MYRTVNRNDMVVSIGTLENSLECAGLLEQPVEFDQRPV